MDGEPPEDKIGTNAADRPSMSRMKANEGDRESRSDDRINGTSVVPYVH